MKTRLLVSALLIIVITVTSFAAKSLSTEI